MPETVHKRKVFLVEDHPVTREGFAQLINYQDDLLVCGQAENVATAISEIGRAKPDLAVVDVSLPDGHGIELVRDLRRRFPRMCILVLSMHDEEFYAERALNAGAGGYVMKQENADIVMEAIRQILLGETYLSPKLRRKMKN